MRSDREYFREHPQYYMYRHPEMPSHETILAARDRMLQAHPALRFDAVHLASLEWDVDQVAGVPRSLSECARGRGGAHGAPGVSGGAAIRDKVRRFLIRYQDRILYGSDDAYGPGDSDPAAVAAIHNGWLHDWRFLVTAEPMHSEDFDGVIPRAAAAARGRRQDLP